MGKAKTILAGRVLRPRARAVLPALGASCLLSLAYTAACARLLHTAPLHGSPIYSWQSCVPLQLVLLPGLVLWAWRRSPEFPSLDAWLLATRAERRHRRRPGGFAPPSADPPISPEDWFLVAITAYLAKDIPVGMDAKFWAHHVVCWVTIFAFFWIDPVPLFICGAAVLEVGSASQSVLYLWPSLPSAAAHAVLMTCSNLVAAWLLVKFIARPGTCAQHLVRILLGVAAVGLFLGRQHSCILNFVAWSSGDLAAALGEVSYAALARRAG